MAAGSCQWQWLAGVPAKPDGPAAGCQHWVAVARGAAALDWAPSAGHATARAPAPVGCSVFVPALPAAASPGLLIKPRSPPP